MIITQAGVYLPFLILLIAQVEACIRMIPLENVGLKVELDPIVNKHIQLYRTTPKTLPDTVQVFPRTSIQPALGKTSVFTVVPRIVIESAPKKLPVVTHQIVDNTPFLVKESNKFVSETSKNIEKATNSLIEQSVLVVEKTPELKKFVSVFSACQLNNIHYVPPKTAERKDHIITPTIQCLEKSAFGCQTANVTCETPPDSIFPLVSGFAKIDGAEWATTDLKTEKAEFLLECDIYNRWTYISDIPGISGKVFPTNEVFCLLVPILTASDSDAEYSDIQTEEKS